MSGINIDSIMSKVNKYSKTKEGKQKIKECINNYRSQGRRTTAGGGQILTDAIIVQISEELIRIMKETANAKQLPESVRKHFDSLVCSQPVYFGKDNSKCKVEVSFTDDLSRFSLMITKGEKAGQRTGEGIKNIVSLFDTGYTANKAVYGTWDGHEDLGVIKSKTSREGQGFIKEAVDTFNRQYGGLYNVHASITASPEFYTR